MGIPLRFIEIDTNDQLKINPIAIDLLKDLNCPLKIISIAGLYRTGKSFILSMFFN
jgi:hypothetical protein